MISFLYGIISVIKIQTYMSLSSEDFTDTN